MGYHLRRVKTGFLYDLKISDEIEYKAAAHRESGSPRYGEAACSVLLFLCMCFDHP